MTEAWANALLVFNAALTIMLVVAVMFLYRQWGAIVLQGAEGIATHHGPRVGHPAPRVFGHDLTGDDWVEYEPRRQVLVFGSPGCPICEEKGVMFRDLTLVQERWGVTYVHSGDDPEGLPGRVREFVPDGRLRVLLDPERRTHQGYEISVSPFVVAVDEAGRIAAKSLVGGLPDLVDLLVTAGDDSLAPVRDDLLEGRIFIDVDADGGFVVRQNQLVKEAESGVAAR
jgi:hypothetical protein